MNLNNSPLSGAALILRPFQEFLKAQTSSGILLIVTTAIAFFWANSPWSGSYFHLWEIPIGITIGSRTVAHAIHYWINDGLMAIFFLVVGLEIKREMVVGELASIKKATLPILAAIGGMIVPAAIYLFLNPGQPLSRGWGIPMATDIAFSLGILALLGPRIPLALKVFLSAFAIVDDIGAVLVIAFFYTSQISWWALGFALMILLLLYALNRLDVQPIWPYLLLGLFLWWCILKSGVHSTVAGVLLALFIPSRGRIRHSEFVAESKMMAAEYEKLPADGEGVTSGEQQAVLSAMSQNFLQVQAPLQRLEHWLHPWVAFLIIPVFALANAGVSMQGASAEILTHSVFLGVFLGLIFGKQIGVFIPSWLGVKTRVANPPQDVSWRQIYGVGWLGGIGFTMSIFVTSLAFQDGGFLTEAKLGVLCASLVSAIGGLILLRR